MIKEAKNTQDNPIPVKEDLSHVTCFKCKEPWHYISACPRYQKAEVEKIGIFNCKNPWLSLPPPMGQDDTTTSRYNDHDHNHNHNGHKHGSNNGRGRAPRDPSKLLYYQCRKLVHFARDCPESAAKNGSHGGMDQDHLNQGHVNHVNMEKAIKEPEEVEDLAIDQTKRLLEKDFWEKSSAKYLSCDISSRVYKQQMKQQ